MWILFAAKALLLLFCLSLAARSHMGDSSGNVWALYSDLQSCVNGFLHLHDKSKYEENI